jgi:hypothetical protein
MLGVSTLIETGTPAVGILAVAGKFDTCGVAVMIAEPFPMNELIALMIGANGLDGPVEEGWLAVVPSGPRTDDNTVGTDSIADADARLALADIEETTLCNVD